MIQEVNIPVVRLPKVGLPIVGWESRGENESPSKPERIYPAYELSCESSEFIKNNEYTVRVRQTQAASEQMQVQVVCVGGTVTPSSFGTDSPQNLKVTPSQDTCIVTLVCDGREVGRFEMREVLTVPEYIFVSSETEFEIGTEYELTVARVTAPIKQTQIEVACTGGLVSPQFLVDEGTPFAFDGPNSNVLVTPTEERCVVTLKVNLAGVVYSVGKFTMKAQEPAKEYLVSTITIDQNVTDPETMITGDINGDAIKAIRANSHIYLGKYTGDGEMTICQLDDADSTKFANGQGSAVLTGAHGDVFMRLPQFFYNAEEKKTDVWDISFAYGGKPADDWMEWDGNDLIGVYKAYNYRNKTYSRSGVTPTVSVSQDDFKKYARARGNGYTIVKHKHQNIMAFLFYAMYGNTNAQAICGSGNSTNGKKTGLKNSLGMTDTTSANGNTDSIKFWGLENWWGDIYEWEDNVNVDERVWNVTEDDNTVRTLPTAPTSSNYITKLQIGKYLDTTPSAVDGSATTGYCDYYYQGSSKSLIVSRSRYGATANGGIVFSGATNGSSKTDSDHGSRLAFRGTVREEAEAEVFKEISVTN